MSRKANSEQLLAIEHKGGVLLRAGAGSGKTFVLVEHILYLTSEWINEFIKNPSGSFEEFLRLKYSQVVMMTFTKKAAGEMSIRLNEKFLEKSTEVSDSQKYWMIANEVLPSLTVTTIDGFCRKLITLGYFPALSTEANIIFDAERIDQVNTLVDDWYNECSHNIDQALLDIIIRVKRDLLYSFTHVFSDPGLRLAWKKFKLSEIGPASIDKLLAQSFVLNDLSDSLAAIYSLGLDEEISKRTVFEKFIETLQNTGLPVVDSVEKFRIYQSIFSSVKSLPSLSGAKKTPEAILAKDGLSNLKEWVNKWKDVIGDYETHFESKVLPWMKLCLELFQYIEKRLDPNQGMTFGDIEYFVSLGLENAADKERIHKTFQYFIVDEFQDTSNIQFKIIRELIDNNFSKLFCVGDAKQAIYGFRGGELSVFQDCGELVPKVLSLANNYRSLPQVITFNNSLFEKVLPLGQHFEGHDPFSVKPEDQNVPDGIDFKENGSIKVIHAKLERDLENDGKFSNEDINRLEAIVIADSIMEERKTSQNVCTILYSKLRPSNELIRALMERKIGFTAQFKIQIADDPILGIFIALLRRRFDSNKSTLTKYPLFILESYFKVLGINVKLQDSYFEEFDRNMEFWGIVPAFQKFLNRLQITNENSDINIDIIETIAELYHQDPESILTQILRGDNDKISLDLRSGENSHMVQIMSAHASKGLEFDSVYLAGIYTNGRDQGDGALFGDLPGSFTWYLDISQKEKQKSPLYVYENELAKYKNFSESKRLLYVACTRAKKKLTWVDFEIPEKGFVLFKNSWIQGLTTWLTQNSSFKLDQVILENFNSDSILKAQSQPQLPLFFHDPMGIYTKGEGETELLIAAELSVTRLNALIDCPRKFYLSNILKLPEPQTKKFYTDEDESEDLATIVRSSSERGTYIHAQIAQGILRNFIVPRESFGKEMHEPIQWALDMLKELKVNYDLIPEKQIKFKLFNFMISGIPDLVLMPKGDEKAQIWDFKTGRITQENLSHYWIQLSAYAYALYVLGQIPKESEVKLVLCFVDQKNTLEEVVNFDSCKERLYPLWRSQNEPWKINSDHCSQCSYGSICPR